MTVKLDIRKVESPSAVEIYISAAPIKNKSPEKQAEILFKAVSDALNAENAHIFQERIFTHESALKVIPDTRSWVYGQLDDGVPPTILLCNQGLSGPLAGVQVHAVRSDTKLQVVKLQEKPCGHLLKIPDREYLALSNITAPNFPDTKGQAMAMLEKGEAILKQFGADFLSVPRTWMWLGDILSWYDDFNKVRNDFFTERGIIGKGPRQSAPASTGIGLTPADHNKCSMDLTAVLKPADSIEYLPATGKQRCALEYGSAFSRASRAVTPAGRTVFVSGTASIDVNGATTNVGDAAGQINATIDNVRAVLKDMQCRNQNVVQVIAYCKTIDVEKAFKTIKDQINWPWLTVICDICRPDLLFEIEATAMPRG